jgi:hypothetical protein
MVKNEFYYLEQTPRDLALDLLTGLPIEKGDCLFEPFKGEGHFYDQFPADCPKDWCEIEEGRDYKSGIWSLPHADWVITNPPFQVDVGDKRVNSFFSSIEYFSHIAKKGMAFFGSDRCISTLTPIRLKELASRGWYLTGLKIVSVKAWRGRYYWMVFGKTPNPTIGFLEKNYTLN